MSGEFSQVIDSCFVLFYRDLHGMLLLSPSLKPSFSFLLFPLLQSQTQQFYRPHVSPGPTAQQGLLAQGHCGVHHAQRCLSLAGSWSGAAVAVEPFPSGVAPSAARTHPQHSWQTWQTPVSTCGKLMIPQLIQNTCVQSSFSLKYRCFSPACLFTSRCKPHKPSAPCY